MTHGNGHKPLLFGPILVHQKQNKTIEPTIAEKSAFILLLFCKISFLEILLAAFQCIPTGPFFIVLHKIINHFFLFHLNTQILRTKQYGFCFVLQSTETSSRKVNKIKSRIREFECIFGRIARKICTVTHQNAKQIPSKS